MRRSRLSKQTDSSKTRTGEDRPKARSRRLQLTPKREERADVVAVPSPPRVNISTTSPLTPRSDAGAPRAVSTPLHGGRGPSMEAPPAVDDFLCSQNDADVRWDTSSPDAMAMAKRVASKDHGRSTIKSLAAGIKKEPNRQAPGTPSLVRMWLHTDRDVTSTPRSDGGQRRRIARRSRELQKARERDASTNMLMKKLADLMEEEKHEVPDPADVKASTSEDLTCSAAIAQLEISGEDAPAQATPPGPLAPPTPPDLLDSCSLQPSAVIHPIHIKRTPRAKNRRLSDVISDEKVESPKLGDSSWEDDDLFMDDDFMAQASQLTEDLYDPSTQKFRTPKVAKNEQGRRITPSRLARRNSVTKASGISGLAKPPSRPAPAISKPVTANSHSKILETVQKLPVKASVSGSIAVNTVLVEKNAVETNIVSSSASVAKKISTDAKHIKADKSGLKNTSKLSNSASKVSSNNVKVSNSVSRPEPTESPIKLSPDARSISSCKLPQNSSKSFASTSRGQSACTVNSNQSRNDDDVITNSPIKLSPQARPISSCKLGTKNLMKTAMAPPKQPNLSSNNLELKNDNCAKDRDEFTNSPIKLSPEATSISDCKVTMKGPKSMTSGSSTKGSSSYTVYSANSSNKNLNIPTNSPIKLSPEARPINSCRLLQNRATTGAQKSNANNGHKISLISKPAGAQNKFTFTKNGASKSSNSTSSNQDLLNNNSIPPEKCVSLVPFPQPDLDADTSLPDDILLQIAEPDEAWESQVTGSQDVRKDDTNDELWGDDDLDLLGGSPIPSTVILEPSPVKRGTKAPSYRLSRTSGHDSSRAPVSKTTATTAKPPAKSTHPRVPPITAPPVPAGGVGGAGPVSAGAADGFDGDDDSFCQPDFLAKLAEAEFEATQSLKSSSQSTEPTRSTCTTNTSKPPSVPRQPSLPTASQQCTMTEIQRKKEAALRKRRMAQNNKLNAKKGKFC